MEKIYVTQTTIKRLVSDIKECTKVELTKDGIYYKHDENNMLFGYALIIGPKETPYAYGNFMFKFEFPIDYPHNPPKVTYCTNDGITRFHPNLYKNGKVCLSMLNTWQGEQWTGCQTIKSVLVTIQSLMHDNALINEPNIPITHKNVKPYDEIIRYKTIDTGIVNILNGKYLLKEFEIFRDIIKTEYNKNYDEILKILNVKKSEKINKINDLNRDIYKTNTYNSSYIIVTRVYGLSIKIDYENLKLPEL